MKGKGRRDRRELRRKRKRRKIGIRHSLMISTRKKKNIKLRTSQCHTVLDTRET